MPYLTLLTTTLLVFRIVRVNENCVVFVVVDQVWLALAHRTRFDFVTAGETYN